MKKAISILSILILSFLTVSTSAFAQEEAVNDEGYVFDESYTEEEISKMLEMLKMII
ncbi:hypothetical protein [Cytobacillus horneckiae]|uniref:hypothetical protein n=1 Tax=Cytobacillus horneckiae TaxID=549687 RepID=UPI003D9A671B